MSGVWSLAWTGVLLGLLASFCFRLYLSYFDQYSLTYGSLGAVIILLLWFYLTGAAILIGGKVNAEIEQWLKRMRPKLSCLERRVHHNKDHPAGP